MREFIYFSKKARTSGNFRDLMKAGRLDIVCHTVIMAFFVSHALRKNIRLHLFFYGPPDPPKHLEITNTKNEFVTISKKDISGLLKRMLFKYKKNRKIEVFPGCFIEKKSFSEFIEKLNNEERNIYLLDPRGEDIRKVNIKKNPVFIFGDHEGIPRHELKKIRKLKINKVSLGPVTYFASQSVIILQNELDRMNII